jgi:predicted transcriptional regulator of viral defense system
VNTTASALVRISRRADRQYGVITRGQILELLPERSLTRFIKAGLLERIYSGVYRIATAPLTWRGEVLAAVYRAGEEAVASHGTAGALWKFTGFEDGAIDVTTPNRMRPWEGAVVHLRELPDAQVTKIGLIPVTTIARTIFDLASVVDQRRLGRALDDAIRQRRVSLPKVIGVFEELGGPGRQGTTVMRHVLEQRDPRASLRPTVASKTTSFG